MNLSIYPPDPPPTPRTRVPHFLGGGGGGGRVKTSLRIAATVVDLDPCSRQITLKRVVRSSAGMDTIYPPFWGVICVGHPKVWYWMFSPL